MARGRFFSHTSPGGATFVDRIRGTGYLAGARSWAIGENIAYGSGSRSSPRSIGRAWMNSPGHRANILSSNYREIGIGLAIGTPVGSRRRHLHDRLRPAVVASRALYATSASSTPSSTRSESRLSAISSSTASSTARWTSGHAAVSSTSSGSAPPMVMPPSKRSNTRGSM